MILHLEILIFENISFKRYAKKKIHHYLVIIWVC